MPASNAEMDAMLTRRPCAACLGLFSPKELKKCSGCHSTLYCSVACSKNNWKAHKDLCKYNKAVGDSIEIITIDQPYEIVLKEQFKRFTELIVPQIAGAAAQAYGLRAEGSPQPTSGNAVDGKAGPLPHPSTHILLIFFSFDMRQRELLRQFSFEGGATCPLTLFEKRTRGFHEQEVPPVPPGLFSRDWLDNHIGMGGLPAEAPRIPIAIEAHFSKDTWNLTGGPSFTAHHTGLSTTLPSPGAMFPAPPPETWIRDLGDHLAAMQQVGWKEKREIRTERVRKEMKEQLVGPNLTEAQFEDVWRWRQHSQRFFGQND
ncbi:hypothetical protein BCR35DRAFT_303012 [Leucosporidium creatinivorum]|uniref:MYND-type domain-containing protein n=1 Tax=Leucosporidium creatinivorum TaxID=106004 RepID=A0A1Y2FM64_9BASI|nr:hypothetical protein BCR35DRAFT_303012 [Leucosporidium creatinivorum]